MADHEHDGDHGEHSPGCMCGAMEKLMNALRSSGLPPSAETGGMLVCVAASFYMMEGHPRSDFIDTAERAFNAAEKTMGTFPKEKQQMLSLLRMMRTTPQPGSEEARAKGCICPSQEEADRNLGPKPKGAVLQLALDPMCKVHGEMTIAMAKQGGLVGSA